MEKFTIQPLEEMHRFPGIEVPFWRMFGITKQRAEDLIITIHKCCEKIVEKTLQLEAQVGKHDIIVIQGELCNKYAETQNEILFIIETFNKVFGRYDLN